MASTYFRLILALLIVACIFASTALAASHAPVIYNYQDPDTGAIVNYVGIPGGPVVYSKVGPGGIKSVTSINSGNPVVYSSLGPQGITSITDVGTGGPAVYSTTGPGGVSSITIPGPGMPAIVPGAGPGTPGNLARNP